MVFSNRLPHEVQLSHRVRNLEIGLRTGTKTSITGYQVVTLGFCYKVVPICPESTQKKQTRLN